MPSQLGVDINIKEKAMVESLPEGGKVYRLGIRSKEAHSINAFFDDNFHIDKDSKLFVYSLDKKQVKGPFSHNDKKFYILPVKGDVIIFELYEPENTGLENHFIIAQVYHGYRDIFKYSGESIIIRQFGTSGECNVDINCQEGDDWQIEKQSVCMILANGLLSTGVLINNSAHDGTPYVLTAYHCYAKDESYDFENGVKYSSYFFNHEYTNCNGDDTTVAQYVSGASDIAYWPAGSGGTDFCLVQLDSIPPNSFHPYYSGWYRVDSDPDSAVAIHHPIGDVKKISITDSITHSDWLPTRMWKTKWITGVMEEGSSGAPYYNMDHRIIGTHYRGYSKCSDYNANTYSNKDYAGRFAVSWNGDGTESGRLRDHLDSLNTNATELPGMRFYHNGTINDTFPLNGDIVKLKNVDIDARSDITITFKDKFETEGTFTVPEGATLKIKP